MVETYSQNANRNMRRPVVKEEIVDFMRTRQAQNTGYLKDLEDFARQENPQQDCGVEYPSHNLPKSLSHH